MIYGLYYADNGAPKTGLSPTFDTFIKKSDGSSAGSPPTISELANGWYKFSYVPSEEVLIVLDSNDSDMADIDRYVSGELTPDDGNLDASVLVVSDQVTSVQADLDDPNQYKADVSGLATQSSINAIASNVTLIKKIETGRWKIINNQMIFYDDDGTTPILTVDLLDQDGNPTEIQPKERVPV